jgi:tripartite-type tricarboxylate transporter receptor subunit TctC
VPTIGESVPGYAAPVTWFGILGPAGMPVPIVQRINAEARNAIATPEVRARLEGIGFEVAGNSVEEFAASVKAEGELIGKIISAAGIKPE